MPSNEKKYGNNYHNLKKPFKYKRKSKLSHMTPEERAEHIRSIRREGKRKQNAKARSYAWQYKSCHPCEECGESHPACLVFHHKDPSEKDQDICKIIKSGIKAVRREIAKCAVLCQNCHMKHHYEEQGEEDSKWEYEFEDLPNAKQA